MTVDAEVHFWKYRETTEAPLIRNNKMLREDYLPSQLSLNLQRNGVDACLAVSAEPTEVETRFLAELALTHPMIRGVIGWIDLTDKNAAEKMEELSSYPAIRGFKTDAEGLLSASPSLMETLVQHQYTLDLRLSPGSETASLNKRIGSFPDQTFILENGANPDTKTAPSPAWTQQIQELAKNQNLFCKVAGFFTLGNWKAWKPADFYPFLDILFDSFGAGRLLYASDWPFLLLSGSYVQWKSMMEKYTERLLDEERERFFGETANRIYHL
jgi:L-fuconolactonase